jgi:hypothetical protein
LERVSLRSKIYVTGLIMGTLAWTASLTPVLSSLSLSLSLSLFHVSPLFLLFFGSTLGQRWRFPLSALFLFFPALHTVSLGMHGRGTFPFGIIVEGGKKGSGDDFERLYGRKRTQMKQTGGMERGGLRAPLLLYLSQTHLLFLSLPMLHARALSSRHHRAPVPSPHSRHRCMYSKGTGKMV